MNQQIFLSLLMVCLTALQTLFVFILNGIRKDLHTVAKEFTQHLRDHATGQFSHL